MTNKKETIHFIAIGGSAMHNLAIALKTKGHNVTGSDDEIFEPSKTRLASHNLLPEKDGWFPEKITKDIDALILGMHARKDNPELLKAQELGLKIYSYPEYIYEQNKDKQRIVIAGSHGKTTITSMILHVLKVNNKKFDYLVGAQIQGFDTMVKLSHDAPIIVIEGDEYFSSPLDPKPKFLHYQHHIGLISGIAWDHVNVFPTFDDYARQFDLFADSTPKGGTLIFCENDDLATVICRKEREDVLPIGYQTHKNKIVDGQSYLITENGEVPVKVFGDHNMKNINGAKSVCSRIGVSSEQFYNAIQSFEGASNRLELLGQHKETVIYKDFAHSPSKLKATAKAVKGQFPKRELVACMELHTFSSLNKNFLSQYENTFKSADEAIVYFNPKTIEHKKLAPITVDEVKQAFNDKKLIVFTDSGEFEQYLLKKNWKGKNLLLMSSGNFNGLNLKDLSKKIIESI
ncbi:MAG TPA: Mur ligase family protein [Cytophagales bacterium]|nr:Mur ligase family protein [Cytophagales bacterium]